MTNILEKIIAEKKIALDLIKKANNTQIIDLDCYPYTASSTMLLKNFIKRADKVLVTWSDKINNFEVSQIEDLLKNYEFHDFDNNTKRIKKINYLLDKKMVDKNLLWL